MLFRSAFLAFALLGAQVSGATASVIYTFTQTEPTRSSYTGGIAPVVATAVLVVSNEAYAQGFSMSYRNDQFLPGTVPQAPLGLDALYIGVLGAYRPINVSLDQFLTVREPSSGWYSHLSLSAAPGGLLNGSLYFNNSESDVTFTFSGVPAARGAFNTDAPSEGRCNISGSCTFAGVQTATVPEPASLALFGTALAGFAMLRRRRG